MALRFNVVNAPALPSTIQRQAGTAVNARGDRAVPGSCSSLGPFGLRTDLMWDRLDMLAELDEPAVGADWVDPFASTLTARHPGDEEDFDDEDIDDEDDLDDEFDDEDDDDLDDDFDDEDDDDLDEDIDDELDGEIDDLDADDEDDLDDDDEDDDLDDEEDEDIDDI